MKEFEKWCKNNYNPDEDLTASEDFKEGYKDGREDGWKAALEWVLSIDSGFCSCGVPNDSWQEDGVLAKIEKEIKE